MRQRYVYHHVPTWWAPTGSMFWDACWWMTTIPMFIAAGKAIGATIRAWREVRAWYTKENPMIRETLTCDCGAKGQIEARDQRSFDILRDQWIAKHAPHAPQQEPEVTEPEPEGPVAKPTRRAKAKTDEG